MANEILEALARANIIASAAVLLVLVLRDPVRRWFGARAAYALWTVALCAPVAGFLPSRTIGGTVAAPPTPSSPLQMVQEVLGTEAYSGRVLQMPVSQMPDLTWLIIVLWSVGFAVSAGILIARQFRFRRALGVLRPAFPDGNAYLSESISHGPLVAGVLNTKIILPADFASKFNDEESSLILAHEQVHVSRGDTQINLLIAFLQCLNWFNPLMHVAAFQIRLDQEIACDADVMAIYPGKRRAYAEAMLKNTLALTAVPVGCAWPARSAHPLRKRIALLNCATPLKTMKRLGVAIVAVASLAGGYASWAAQPPSVTPSVPRTALRNAAAGDQTTGNGASMTQRDALGRHLVQAMQRGDLSAARKLLANGADANYHLAGEGTPLVAAARRKSMEAVELLLKSGADPNRAAQGDGNPLIVSAAGGDVAIMSLLVAHGADVNAIVADDETPLINASGRGQAEAVKYLIGKGADVNLRVLANPERAGGELRSPLGMALKNRHAAIADMLRSAGARD
jgi:beta-lactamase regulating signal transducer with metallopeptidase domain